MKRNWWVMLLIALVASCTVIFGDSNKVDIRVNRELDVDSTVGDVGSQQSTKAKQDGK